MFFKNVRYNYISQIYTMFVSIIFIPYFIKVLGSEAYGLVGFFGMMQASFALLDMGLTAVIVRETAKYTSNKDSEKKFASLCYVLNIIFIIISFVIFLSVFFLKDVLINRWFDYQLLTDSEVSFSFIAMAIFISLKWISGLYRGVIQGSEDFKTIANVNILVSSIRYVIVVPVFYFIDESVSVFFTIQVVAGLVELLYLRGKYNDIRPCIVVDVKSGLQSLKKLIGFSSYAGLISILYIISSQFDKLYLSKILTLNNYGLFSFAIVFATIINMISAPIHHVLQPRLTSYYINNSKSNYTQYYRNISIIFNVVVIVVSSLVIISAKPILLLLAYDANTIKSMCSIVFLYVYGNAFFAISCTAYFMQYSQGILKYHFYGVGVLAISFIMLVLKFSNEYKYIGTGSAWLILNMLFVLLWVPYIYSKLLKEYDLITYYRDLITITIPPVIVMLCIKYFDTLSVNSTVFDIVASSVVSVVIFILIIFTFYFNLVRKTLRVLGKVDEL